jgi:choice-of-anchor B domain-containing protein
MDLLGEWSDPSLPYYNGIIYNDIWGYTDADDNEFAIIGSAKKVHFIDITDPSSIVEVDNFTGGTNSSSIWRDIKTYGKYAYSVADQWSEGLMIFDMGDLPASVTKVYQSNSFFNKAHNIFIDEDHGRLYVLGSNANNSDIIVLDIETDPENPALLGSPNLNGGSIHDAYVRDHIVYVNHGNAGLYVYDMTDASNPIELGNLTGYLNSGYNHSCWLSDDGLTMVFCDETHGRKVKAIDMEDLTDLAVYPSNLFFSNLEGGSPLNSVAHNPIIKGNYVYISYYQDGVQVFDISDKNNVTKVAYYDTYPDNSGNSGYNGYAGAWGVFPLFDSGKIIASDDIYGLTVLELSNPLPVGLTRFVAQQRDQSSALITWTTSHEENSALFEVQRSEEGQVFSTIGKVSAAGNSASDKMYEFVDEAPFSGVNYYRLRQVDFDGRANYSAIRSLDFISENSFQIFPSIVESGEIVSVKVNLEAGPAGLTFELLDVQGKQIRKSSFGTETKKLMIHTENLPPGSYIGVLNKKGTTIFSQKIVITD